MKSLKNMLLSGMFVFMAAALLVACGDDDTTAPVDASDTPEAGADAAGTAAEGSASSTMRDRVKAGTATIDAAEDIKDDAEEDWFAEEIVGNGSAANQ